MIRNHTEDQSLKMDCILVSNLVLKEHRLCLKQQKIVRCQMFKTNLQEEMLVQRLVFLLIILLHPPAIKHREDSNNKYRLTMVEFSHLILLAECQNQEEDKLFNNLHKFTSAVALLHLNINTQQLPKIQLLLKALASQTSINSV